MEEENKSINILEDELYKDFLEYFEGKIPNPNNYPKQFEFYVKIYLNAKRIHKEK